MAALIDTPAQLDGVTAEVVRQGSLLRVS